jgi:hypothetical protein
MSTTTQAGLPPATELPLFYREPRPLDVARHGKAGLAAVRSLGFAAKTNSIPLAADEFYTAQAHYPIVFAGGGRQPSAVAVVGVANADNLFIDAAGKWRDGAYVPAYVRRYPFVFIRSPDESKYILAIDEAAESYASGGGQPLFEGEEPSAATKHALQFCVEFQRHYEVAQAFAAAAEAEGLLTEYRADLRRGGKVMTLSGFRVVDEAKFNGLSDETFLEWRKRGWIALTYAHLMSMRRWEALAAMTDEKKG